MPASASSSRLAGECVRRGCTDCTRGDSLVVGVVPDGLAVVVAAPSAGSECSECTSDVTTGEPCMRCGECSSIAAAPPAPGRSMDGDVKASEAVVSVVVALVWPAAPSAASSAASAPVGFGPSPRPRLKRACRSAAAVRC